MDSTGIEREYDHLEVVTEPSKAHLVFDTVRNDCFQFSSWSEVSSGIQVRLDSAEADHTVTVLPYLLPTNRYYFVRSESFEEHR